MLILCMPNRDKFISSLSLIVRYDNFEIFRAKDSIIYVVTRCLFVIFNIPIRFFCYFDYTFQTCKLLGVDKS
jgi:hypothetical protein